MGGEEPRGSAGIVWQSVAAIRGVGAACNDSTICDDVSPFTLKRTNGRDDDGQPDIVVIDAVIERLQVD